MKKCKNRNCNKYLTDKKHGNRDYCIGPDDDPDKCLKEEKEFLRKERIVLRQRQSELKTTLENITHGANIFKSITLDRFEQLIYPYVDLFELRFYKGNSINYFSGFELSKHEVDHITYIHISKSNP